MTKPIWAPIIWAVAILALLAGAYVIVTRNGSATPEQPAAGYMH